MAFGGFTSVMLSRHSPPASLPPHISVVYDKACHIFAWVRGNVSRAGGATETLYQQGETCGRLSEATDKSFVFIFSRLVRSFFLFFCACAQPHAPPAYHYQASGPYCITDGADRRERRQPTCFLERLGVCS